MMSGDGFLTDECKAGKCDECHDCSRPDYCTCQCHVPNPYLDHGCDDEPS